MADPITNIVLARMALYCLAAERRGEEEWDEEHAAAVIYLMAHAAVMNGPLSALALSGLDAKTCAAFDERMRENGMNAEELVAFWDDEEKGGIAFEMDVLVLRGMLTRRPVPEGKPMYSLTDRGKAEVENKLLPEAEGLVN